MRVLLVHNHYKTSSPSGEDSVYRSEREMLERNGFEVAAYERFNDDIREAGFGDRLRAARDLYWSKGSHAAMTDVLRRFKPDVAHFHNTFPLVSASAYAACRDHGVPIVQTLHNYRLICPNGLLLRDNRPCESCVGHIPLPAIRHACYRQSRIGSSLVAGMLCWNRLRRVYRDWVTRYIALTHFAAKKFCEGGIQADKISVKPNFMTESTRRAAERGDRRGAIFVGRLGEEKGVRTLLQAWQELGDIPLEIVGDGPLRDELEAFSRAHGLTVRFHGQVTRERVLELVSGARVQVIPSECYEGFPMVVLEAFACGTAIVASRLGGLAEIIENEVTGLHFTPGDAADLAASVRSAIEYQTMCRLAAAGRARVAGEYSERANIRILEDIYRQAIAEGNRE